MLALALGFIFRSLTAYFVYGSQSLDDYRHGVWPAYQFFRGETIDLPDYRSPLLVWGLGLWLKISALFSVTTPVAQVRSMYFILGLNSLLILPAFYLWSKNNANKLFASLGLYVLSLHAFMSFISTRSFGEALAMTYVTIGLCLCETGRQNLDKKENQFWLLLGFLSLGLATLLRFQAGLIYVTYMTYFIYQFNLRLLAIGFFAGIISLLAQLGIDMAAHRVPFETILNYFKVNENIGPQYGESPWYATWLTALLMMLVPFSFGLFRYSKRLWSQHKAWIVCVLVFLFCHSLISHKEERFIYPVAGMLALFLAFMWAEDIKENRSLSSWILVVVNSIFLLFISFNNTQSGEIEPISKIEARFNRFTVLDKASPLLESFVRDYYLRPPNQILDLRNQALNENYLDNSDALKESDGLLLITSQEEVKEELLLLASKKTALWSCEDLQEAASFIDKFIYHFNPERNQRRRPSWFIICVRS